MDGFVRQLTLVTCNDRLKGSSASYYENFRLTYPVLKNCKKPVFYSFDEMLFHLEEMISKRYFKPRQPQNEDDIWQAAENEFDLGVDAIGTYAQSSKVTFEAFDIEYYLRFPTSLKKKFSSSILWLEINSFIKGSIAVLSNSSNFLSRQQYLSLEKSRGSVLSLEDRELIYDAFLTYEKLRGMRLEWDVGELTMYIYRALESKKFSADIVSYIYLDEVQGYPHANPRFDPNPNRVVSVSLQK